MQTISKADFESIFNIHGDTSRQDLLVNDTVELKSTTVNPGYKRVFDNCHIKSLKISGVQFNNSLVFRNCIFGMDNFVSVEIKGFRMNSEGQLTFQDCVFYNKCEFKNIVGETESLKRGVIFSSCTFQDELLLKSIINIDFSIENSKTEKNLMIDSFGNVEFSLSNVVVKKVLAFSKNSSLNNIYLLGGEFEEIYLYTSNYKLFKTDHLKGGTTSTPAKIKALNLVGLELPKTTVTIIKSSNIDKLKLQNTVFDGRFRLTDSDLNRVELIDSNLGDSEIHNITVNQTFLLENSFLGKSTISNTKWPPNNQLLTSELESGKHDLKTFRILRESYRQLKELYLKQSNHIEALKFYRNEMDIHWKIVSPNLEKQKTSKRWQDYIIVGSNRLFSDFGQSLFRPIAWLFGTHLILFFILIGCGLYNGLRLFGSSDPNFFIKAVGSYFNLLNPAHKFMDEALGGLLFIDFLMRLCASYFIFHIIRASRKYSKL